jgi:hypothetical protein
VLLAETRIPVNREMGEVHLSMDTEGQTTFKAIELKLEGIFGTVGEDGAGICW